MGNFEVVFKGTPFADPDKPSNVPERLEWRAEILLTRNRDAVEGKRILDAICRLRPRYFILDTRVAVISRSVLAFFKVLEFPRKILRALKGAGGHAASRRHRIGAAEASPRVALMEGRLALFRREDPSGSGSTIDETGLVAWPTRRAVEFMLENTGFAYRFLDWKKGGVTDWWAMKPHRRGERVAYLCELKTGDVAASA